jgi:hypothetical protein
MNPIGSKRYVDVVAYDMQLDNGGEGGSPKAIVSLRVVAGDDTGRNLTWYGYLTEKAAPYTMKSLKALGWQGTKLSRAMAEGLGSVRASAKLVVEEYNGKVREKVDGIFPAKVFGAKNPVDASSLDAFDALFEDAAAATENIDVVPGNAAPELPAARTISKAAPENPNSLGF